MPRLIIHEDAHVNTRIYLSPPHMSGSEEALVADAFASNWVAPLGPHVDAFESEFAKKLGVEHAAALSSGTAALHLALQLVGVQHGDVVFVSTFTFAATVYPISYLGAVPHFIDSEPLSWNMDPSLLEDALKRAAAAGKLPRAIVVVHLYGQTAAIDEIIQLADRYDVPVIEDAAEALGATYKGRPAGTRGVFSIFSFNGNKIITTSGGGMLVSDDGSAIGRARKLATQAREPAVHYEHNEIGYNYRMSNLLAAVGRAQLSVLDDRVRARRNNFESYRRAFVGTPGIELMPEADWGTHSRWLTCVTIDPEAFGASHEAVRLNLESENIEARPLWKPMHCQPVFSKCASSGGKISQKLFETGLCLPSGSALTDQERTRVVEIVLSSGRSASHA